ncbi:MAG: 30S ribosome-binding factor RbfA [Bryobacteraceae bacterium]|nr:30S ribosome-binding factor RbfA [Bryobacteraceae bacterium]
MPHRTERVTEALREELSELIAFEIEDPRLAGVGVTEVHVSPDLRLASVRLSIPGDAAAQERALAAMLGAKSFLKKNLAERLDLFRIPELRFEADLSPGANAKLKQLLRRVRKGRPRDTELQEKSAETS